MRTGNQTWDALLGALVGVVRAEQKNAKTVETDRVLFEGFAALAEDDETALQNMLACAHAEKNRIAPEKPLLYNKSRTSQRRPSPCVR